MTKLSFLQIHQLANECQFDFGQLVAQLDDGQDCLGSGADLTPATLIHAYRCGVFPWFAPNEPIFWWSPSIRCVIDPDTFKPSKSLVRTAKKQTWTISVNRAFDDVVRACSQPRAYTEQTWITQSMQAAYQKLHQLGVAVSIEVWQDKPCQSSLIGGLYGINLGGLFCGESMFHHTTDASKIAFWALMVFCRQEKITLVDCQLENPHLMSLGAKLMPRDEFIQKVNHLAITKLGSGFDEIQNHLPVLALLDTL